MLKIVVYDSVKISRPDNTLSWFNVHARRRYYRGSRFDFVRVRGEGGINWIARILGLFRVNVRAHPAIVEPGYINLSVVQWMRQVEDAIPGMATFAFLQEVDVALTESFISPVKLLLLPDDRQNPEPRMVAVPWGKTAAINGEFDQYSAL